MLTLVRQRSDAWTELWLVGGSGCSAAAFHFQDILTWWIAMYEANYRLWDWCVGYTNNINIVAAIRVQYAMSDS